MNADQRRLTEEQRPFVFSIRVHLRLSAVDSAVSDLMLTELGDAGFAIQSQRAVEQKDPRKSMLMQIRAGYRET